MKSIIENKKESRIAWFLNTPKMKSLFVCALILAGMEINAQAQEAQYTKPSWRFGVAAGANLNLYGGTTQQLNLGFTVPKAFHEGKGLGLYLAPLWEFHPEQSMLGFMLQAGYDNRQGDFDHVIEPCNCPADLTADLSYLTFEPSLRFAPFRSAFYLFAGPRVALNFDKSFQYTRGINPDFPDLEPLPVIDEDFTEINNLLVSMQVGAGFDIPLSSRQKQTQAFLSPFVSFQPYLGQNPRAIESWTMTTLRVGAALKFGMGKKIVPDEVFQPIPVIIPDKDVKFTAVSPENIPVERRVRETFPVSNFVFFDLGSKEIPDRYVLLDKDQVKNFKEEQLEEFKPKKLSGRSDRQMIVYYNVLNILGDRMGKNPSSTVRLSGASDAGVADGLAMAESVKKYLVDVFGISAARINTEGRINPRVPSEQPGGTLELVALREEDRRVSIFSETPELMMEFQSGNAPLKPIEIVDIQKAPLDSYVTFTVEGAEEAFDSWSLEVKDEEGAVQLFGPYTQETASIPGKSIMGIRPQGNYKATMVGKTKSGKTVRKEIPVKMKQWIPSEGEEGMRFSLLFEFANAQTIATYEKYLTDVVVPKIPKNGKVIIHGHTDIIGEEVFNHNLSLERALEAKKIMNNALVRTGRSDVKFEVYGFGEDQNESPFVNVTPEERFYNRTVIIDVIPQK